MANTILKEIIINSYKKFRWFDFILSVKINIKFYWNNIISLLHFSLKMVLITDFMWGYSTSIVIDQILTC